MGGAAESEKLFSVGPRACVQTLRGTSPVCSVLETHRGRGLLSPFFRPSRDLSQCLSATVQTVKLLPNLGKQRTALGGSQAGRFVGGGRELKCGALRVCHHGGPRLCVLHECCLLKFSEVSYEDKDRFEMEKKPGRVSF